MSALQKSLSVAIEKASMLHEAFNELTYNIAKKALCREKTSSLENYFN